MRGSKKVIVISENQMNAARATDICMANLILLLEVAQRSPLFFKRFTDGCLELEAAKAAKDYLQFLATLRMTLDPETYLNYKIEKRLELTISTCNNLLAELCKIEEEVMGDFADVLTFDCFIEDATLDEKMFFLKGKLNQHYKQIPEPLLMRLSEFDIAYKKLDEDIVAFEKENALWLKGLHKHHSSRTKKCDSSLNNPNELDALYHVMQSLILDPSQPQLEELYFYLLNHHDVTKLILEYEKTLEELALSLLKKIITQKTQIQIVKLIPGYLHPEADSPQYAKTGKGTRSAYLLSHFSKIKLGESKFSLSKTKAIIRYIQKTFEELKPGTLPNEARLRKLDKWKHFFAHHNTPPKAAEENDKETHTATSLTHM